MVILPSQRTELPAVIATPDDPRCLTIAKRYGEADHLYMAIVSGAPQADTPSMVMVMKTYGPDAVLRQLQNRIRIAVLRMDESALNDEEVLSIATAILNDPRARVLGYDLVMGFFTSLERGEYVLYNMKPRNVMTSWQQYASHAHLVQSQLKEEAERQRREKEWEEHKKQCITLEEYKRRKLQHNDNES